MGKIVRENRLNVVVGVGGGSAIDTAKATAPVSYTHLDVYKRQVLSCRSYSGYPGADAYAKRRVRRSQSKPDTSGSHESYRYLPAPGWYPVSVE